MVNLQGRVWMWLLSMTCKGLNVPYSITPHAIWCLFDWQGQCRFISIFIWCAPVVIACVDMFVCVTTRTLDGPLYGSTVLNALWMNSWYVLWTHFAPQVSPFTFITNHNILLSTITAYINVYACAIYIALQTMIQMQGEWVTTSFQISGKSEPDSKAPFPLFCGPRCHPFCCYFKAVHWKGGRFYGGLLQFEVGFQMGPMLCHSVLAQQALLHPPGRPVHSFR